MPVPKRSPKIKAFGFSSKKILKSEITPIKGIIIRIIVICVFLTESIFHVPSHCRYLFIIALFKSMISARIKIRPGKPQIYIVEFPSSERLSSFVYTFSSWCIRLDSFVFSGESTFSPLCFDASFNRCTYISMGSSS